MSAKAAGAVDAAAGRVVMISAYHDYRTPKKASIHQIADAFVRRGMDVSFVSMRFSHLSKRKGDSRLFLWDRSNRVEMVNGVRCYLWRTLAHPFASGSGMLNTAMRAAFPLYARSSDATVDALVRAADVIMVESSVAVVFLRRLRRLAPAAKIIYWATDRLDTVGAHPYVQERLAADSDVIDHVCVRSSVMAPAFPWAKGRIYRAEFGIDPADFENIGPSPYAGGINAVAVGSMLFDPGAILAAASAQPDVHFHVIGCGMTFDAPANVTIHAEMPFRQTLPYIAHADIGIAPYRDAPGVEYLAESSLKLAQYEALGLPAVCPDFAASDNAARFGYRPGDVASIAAAMAGAVAARGTVKRRRFPTWDDVAGKILQPELHPETAIQI